LFVIEDAPCITGRKGLEPYRCKSPLGSLKTLKRLARLYPLELMEAFHSTCRVFDTGYNLADKSFHGKLGACSVETMVCKKREEIGQAITL